jgi:hypothetical protein
MGLWEGENLGMSVELHHRLKSIAFMTGLPLTLAWVRTQKRAALRMSSLCLIGRGTFHTYEWRGLKLSAGLNATRAAVFVEVAGAKVTAAGIEVAGAKVAAVGGEVARAKVAAVGGEVARAKVAAAVVAAAGKVAVGAAVEDCQRMS